MCNPSCPIAIRKEEERVPRAACNRNGAPFQALTAARPFSRSEARVGGAILRWIVGRLLAFFRSAGLCPFAQTDTRQAAQGPNSRAGRSTVPQLKRHSPSREVWQVCACQLKLKRQRMRVFRICAIETEKRRANDNGLKFPILSAVLERRSSINSRVRNRTEFRLWSPGPRLRAPDMFLWNWKPGPGRGKSGIGSLLIQGIGVRAPSRPWVSGQFAIASGSRRSSKAIWPGSDQALPPDREKHYRAGSSAVPAAEWRDRRWPIPSSQRLTTRGAS